MNIILKERLKNGIGINTGNKIINFLIKQNNFIPCKVKYNIKFKNNDNNNLEFYFGDNLTIDNNILFYKLILPLNIDIIINCNIICNLLIISIDSKIKRYDKVIFKLYESKIPYLFIDSEYLQKIKLHYELYICIKNIKDKLKFLKIDNKIKENIKNKLFIFYNNKENYENLQLMKKINELNKKFIL